jgi:biotin transporter BioY
LEGYHLIAKIHHVFESGRAGGVICFVWATAGYILKWRVAAYSTSTTGADHAGVVFCGMGLCANSAGWLLGFIKFVVVTVFLTVVALGGRVPGKVFFNATEAVADGR